MNRVIMVLWLTTMLMACTSWPPAGQGGAAEWRDLPLNSLPYGTRQTPAFLEEVAVLQNRFNDTQVYLGALHAMGAENCYPAEWQTCQSFSTRIARELEGGLYVDATNDLLLLSAFIDDLRRRLDYVENTITCAPIIRIKQEIDAA
jgi:hypothetical protein